MSTLVGMTMQNNALFQCLLLNAFGSFLLFNFTFGNLQGNIFVNRMLSLINIFLRYC